MKTNVFILILSGALAAVSAYFQVLLVPLIVLIAVMVCDYGSGMVKAWISKQINSKIGLLGIVKKISYMLIVVVGMAVDYVLDFALAKVGIELSQATFAVALIVIIWLIINELISILENLSVIGVPLPSFLASLVKKLKNTVEKEAETKTDIITVDEKEN